MSAPLRTGLSAERTFSVGAADLIDFGKPGLPPVLSTPALLMQLERAAIQALEPVLTGEQLSLGAEIELERLAPTPAGQEVTCTARVVHVDGPRATFQVEARVNGELIARGVHRRVVVKAASIARRVTGMS